VFQKAQKSLIFGLFLFLRGSQGFTLKQSKERLSKAKALHNVAQWVYKIRCRVKYNRPMLNPLSTFN